MLNRDEILRLYGAIRSELSKFPIQSIRNTVAAAGIDVTRITAKSESKSGLGSRAEVMPIMDRLFGEMAPDAQLTALCILAERLIGTNAEFKKNVQEILGRHGFQFLDGTFVPIGLLDNRESKYLPQSSASELARAIARLVENDCSGAITSACGAVDLATQTIYERDKIGDPGKVSFSAKVNTALNHLDVWGEMKKELLSLGIPENDASDIVDNFKRATNHSAQTLQILRKRMGDVHGSKPAIRRIAYDAIKWSSAICGLFEGKS